MQAPARWAHICAHSPPLNLPRDDHNGGRDQDGADQIQPIPPGRRLSSGLCQHVESSGFTQQSAGPMLALDITSFMGGGVIISVGPDHHHDHHNLLLPLFSSLTLKANIGVLLPFCRTLLFLPTGTRGGLLGGLGGGQVGAVKERLIGSGRRQDQVTHKKPRLCSRKELRQPNGSAAVDNGAIIAPVPIAQLLPRDSGSTRTCCGPSIVSG